MKQNPLIICISILSFILALAITLYPIISTWYNERHQSEIFTQYQTQIENVGNEQMQAAKSNAIAYNEALVPGAHLAESFSQEALLSAAEGYANQLNLTGSGVMGYVDIPTIKVNLPIYHGTDESTLEVGIGHLLGSSLPIGGQNTHTVLTAHSGMASQKMFSDLPQLKEGDVFYLNVLDETLAYQVDQISTVLPHDTSLLKVEPNCDYCTLVTCTPFGVNTHRLLVRGVRIPFETAEEIVADMDLTDTTVTSTWEQEYIKGLAIGLGSAIVAVLSAFVVWIIRRDRHEKAA